MLQLIAVHGKKELGYVLDVGCDAGLHAYALAEAGVRSVIGIDIPEYGVRQSDRLTVEAQTSLLLRRLRREVADGFDVASDSVEFRDADIAEIGDVETYDLIVSWQTLEHLTQPARAIERIAAALRPGGISFHQYNPFFAIDGGHSLCTLDFDWGHARLTAQEFCDYLSRYRPAEAERARRFYDDNLNRMTLVQLADHVSAAGLETLALIPWPDQQQLGSVTTEILSDVQGNYPSATLLDLISPTVWLLIRRHSECVGP